MTHVNSAAGATGPTTRSNDKSGHLPRWLAGETAITLSVMGDRKQARLSQQKPGLQLIYRVLNFVD